MENSDRNGSGTEQDEEAAAPGGQKLEKQPLKKKLLGPESWF